MKASIIIPSYNACERLYYNLLSLTMQDFDKDEYEVIVINNGSTDETREMLSSFSGDIKMKTINIEQNVGRAKARNLGIEKASGEIIIFSDSDMISEKHFVEKHIEKHKKKNLVVCGTNWDKIYTYYYKEFNERQKRNFSEIQIRFKQYQNLTGLKDKQCLISEKEIFNGSYKNFIFTDSLSEKGYKRAVDKYGRDLKDYAFPWSFFVTNNCSVSKENVQKAGLFDERYQGWGCEDLDLGYRLYKNKCSFMQGKIRSVHQEHPVNSKDEGIINIYKFTEKYDSIDLLLFYFARYSPIDINSLNDIAKEAADMEKVKEAEFLLELLKDMLKIIEYRELKGIIDNQRIYLLSKKTKGRLINNISIIKNQLKNVEDKYGCTALALAFRKLAYHLFKMKLERY